MSPSPPSHAATGGCRPDAVSRRPYCWCRPPPPPILLLLPPPPAPPPAALAVAAACMRFVGGVGCACACGPLLAGLQLGGVLIRRGDLVESTPSRSRSACLYYTVIGGTID